ncbi:NAD(P)H-dependent oxidoreductase [Mangrovimonas futianensis]|uniref:NAD(P)H-dependent oxidoreductase n=1 Tax=Mangrovimonas futianensis TaxID=2895523 RepID=UPI001E319B78|nr:NAD(P)H-dependent oxidoreductase [Mangrovimonas futianensis]MCF1422903.1 NAD(P)H-dependent oxidoreductase [Mangrovimonas futianensis]
MALLDDLKWRYATKKYNPSKRVSEEKIDKIIEAARLAPSSYGIQPVRVVCVSNQEIKKYMVPVAWNQRIIADCSHVLVFAAWDNYTPERVTNMFDVTTNEREIPQGSAFGSNTDNIANSHYKMSTEETIRDTERQACIAFGLAIAQAAELKVDATPMGGFDKFALDDMLGLNEKGLKSVYLLALGYRESEGDWMVNQKKVRTPKEDFVLKLN